MLDNYNKIFLIITDNKILNQSNINKFISNFKNCDYKFDYRDINNTTMCLGYFNSFIFSDLVMIISHDKIVVMRDIYNNEAYIKSELKILLDKYDRIKKIKTII